MSTTTIDAVAERPRKTHLRLGRLAVAAIVLAGGATATTAVLARRGESTPAPAVTPRSPAATIPDPLVTRFGKHAAPSQRANDATSHDPLINRFGRP